VATNAGSVPWLQLLDTWLANSQLAGSRIPWAFQWIRTPGRYPRFNCWILGWPTRNSQAREYLGPFSGYTRRVGTLASIAGYLVDQFATRRLANTLGLSVDTHAGSVPWLDRQQARVGMIVAGWWTKTPGRCPTAIDLRKRKRVEIPKYPRPRLPFLAFRPRRVS